MLSSIKHIESSYPVLIIAYGRPRNIKNTLEILRAAHVPRVYVSIDGPRNQDIASLQDEILEVLQDYSSEQFEIVVQRHSVNLGVALGVISALDWFFAQCKAGAIIEDDLVLSKHFIEYGKWALKQLANQPRCLFAGGFFVDSGDFSPESPFLCKYPMIWGWITTQENWSIMRKMIFTPKTFSLTKLFSRKEQFWFVGAKRASLGLVDTWDTQLTYEFLRQDYYCILPNVPLIQNVGFDDLATHTKNENPLLQVNLDNEFTFEKSTLIVDHRFTLSYHKFLEQKIYGISFRNLFSVYKFGFEWLFTRKNHNVISLAKRERFLLAQK